MVSTAQKYAFEIEIFTLSREFRARISRSCAQKRHFYQPVRGRSGRIDFFNRTAKSGQLRRGSSPSLKLEGVYETRSDSLPRFRQAVPRRFEAAVAAIISNGSTANSVMASCLYLLCLSSHSPDRDALPRSSRPQGSRWFGTTPAGQCVGST